MPGEGLCSPHFCILDAHWLRDNWAGRTHIPLPPPQARLSSSRGSCHLATQSSHAIAGATRQEGPPLNASQPSRGPGQAKAPTHRSRAGSPGLRLAAGERRGRLPTPTPPTFRAHTRAHTPARARRHTRAYARRCRARDCRVGGGPEWSGR